MAEFMANWPRFLGPTGSSVAARPDAPTKWDGATGAGVAWKSAVTVEGFNSPIVWGDRVFLSGGTREKREVACYEAAGGKLLWQRALEKVPGSPAQAPKVSDQSGYASPTMATDGLRAYVIFATGELAALSFDGAVLWSKFLGVPKNQYGHSTSLAVWQGRVIVQLDQGEGEPANSRLMAFDGATGRALWEKPRAMSCSWSSPIVIEAAGRIQIITLGLPFVVAYALADGQELWRAEVLEGEVTPSPAFAGGLVLAINPSNALYALKPDGTGDVTKTHVAWKAEENIPDVGGPVSSDGLVFTVDSSGTIMCFDLKNGAKVWEHALSVEVHSTPAIAGNRLYVVCNDGNTVVAEVGREYKEVARNKLDDKFVASPAFVQGRIYLRGMKQLYCLTGDAAKPATP
jgi:outer membrane protein assembly factor BamB